MRHPAFLRAHKSCSRQLSGHALRQYFFDTLKTSRYFQLPAPCSGNWLNPYMSKLHNPAHSQPPALQRSDENWVMTAVVVFLVASMVLLGVGYQYLKYSKQQEQSRQERQTYQRYNDYLQSTQETAPTAKNESEPVDMAASEPVAQTASPAEPSMAEKLLNHPAVTPGPGFNAPGVQQTGVTIIDAMDHAQTTGRQR